uniref:Uncharacterized protein n=1 Tax=Pithovirus LCPAC304 TaxID=2506594 RepID=A0A481Z8N5_9VIRU|nr:MAG: hypothetical protein LCPAC304_04940 [Pithovirus LCPAC304]
MELVYYKPVISVNKETYDYTVKRIRVREYFTREDLIRCVEKTKEIKMSNKVTYLKNKKKKMLLESEEHAHAVLETREPAPTPPSE